VVLASRQDGGHWPGAVARAAPAGLVANDWAPSRQPGFLERSRRFSCTLWKLRETSGSVQQRQQTPRRDNGRRPGGAAGPWALPAHDRRRRRRQHGRQQLLQRQRHGEQLRGRPRSPPGRAQRARARAASRALGRGAGGTRRVFRAVAQGRPRADAWLRRCVSIGKASAARRPPQRSRPRATSCLGTATGRPPTKSTRRPSGSARRTTRTLPCSRATPPHVGSNRYWATCRAAFASCSAHGGAITRAREGRPHAQELYEEVVKLCTEGRRGAAAAGYRAFVNETEPASAALPITTRILSAGGGQHVPQGAAAARAGPREADGAGAPLRSAGRCGLAPQGAGAPCIGRSEATAARTRRFGGTDYKRIVELEPSNGAAKAKIRELEPLVEQERQKQMQEMLGTWSAPWWSRGSSDGADGWPDADPACARGAQAR